MWKIYLRVRLMLEGQRGVLEKNRSFPSNPGNQKPHIKPFQKKTPEKNN